MSKNKRKQALLQSMDPSNCAEGVYSVEERVIPAEFQTDSPTVCISEMNCPLDAEVEKGFKDEAAKFLCRELERYFSEAIKKIDELLEESYGWIKMTGDFWYFDPMCALLPEQSTLCFSDTGRSWPNPVMKQEIGGKFTGSLALEKELLFVMSSKNCPFECDPNHKYFCADSSREHSNPPVTWKDLQSPAPDLKRTSMGLYEMILQQVKIKDAEQLYLDCIYRKDDGRFAQDYPSIDRVAFLPVFRLTSDIARNFIDSKSIEIKTSHKLILWSLFRLIPQSLVEDSTFAAVCDFIRENPGCIDLDGDNLLNEDCVAEYYRKNDEAISDAVALLRDRKYPPFEKILCENAMMRLLRCDEVRANIRPEYVDKLLTSPNRGHWDLWAENAEDPGDEQTVIKVPCEYYARNPKFDIQQGGVVGIDFGTKSTTVVRIVAKEKPKPMRIGHGNFSELPTDRSDYENPTVMQFIDVNSFLDAYKKRSGRPWTKWRDLTISHTAADMLREATDSDLFPAFLSELKQWAGGNNELKIKDRRGRVLTLPPYGKLTDGDIDPIEFYAYYIGLNINHMHKTNGIFMRYEISYPVTYDKDILTRLRQSFERGIRKSFPDSILNDAELMKQFRVRFGASEPAAYSLCALKEYGFDPSGDDKIFYGVFDFGGGTTDFDFGTFREATEAEQDAGKDYVLEHFCSSGDKYLGGENILQLLAYDVFKQNKEMLLKENIQFSQPFEFANASFEGDEGLIEDSPEARLNMKLVMEKLRPLWESSKAAPAEEATDSQSVGELDSGTLKVTLFDKTGEQQTNKSLMFNRDELEQKIRDRIRHGVANFFFRLKETFREPYVPKTLNRINLFLAGNSCKSPLVKELFEEYIEDFVKDNEDFKDVFELFPPLGSDEAIQKMKERNPTKTIYTGIECPTGKTGVAFGLVMGREGSNYLVIDKDLNSEGRAFRFYVGRSRKGKFKVILNKASERGRWERVMSVGDSGMVELQYSDLPEAGTGELPEEKTFPINCPVNQPADKDKSLFIRVKSANEFEYALAKDEAAITKNSIRSYRLE